MPDVTFLINGDGSARPQLQRLAASVTNVRFAGYQPASRLAEVLATGDIHVVPLREGLGDVSVPSKTYSSLAAGRPVVASIDLDSAIPRLLADAGAGIAVAPDDAGLLVDALRALLDDPARAAALGAAGRVWAEREASPAAVGVAYDQLLREVAGRRRRLMPRSRR
jgi:colanic acid biosynthesis glycosyl transferase WcaI